jgi:hypothetical protein
MNDELVVQKILKLLENNTAFIGYALNGGIGTKINVRNTETGKTIQALSINVDSSGEVLVVKDSEDGKYKAVTFKAAQQTTERIIQIRKTKPVDDKKIIEYTDTDIEVFYLFVKLIDTGSPVPTQLDSTWIRKGSSCTQFVGAYERCNYAAKETIGGTSYTGLPYKPYPTLNDCLNDDLGRDARTPHGSGDEQGLGSGYSIFSTRMTAEAEANLKGALESHDEHYGTNYKRGFGYGSILECSGGLYVMGWEHAYDAPTPEEESLGIPGKHFTKCDFSYLPGFTQDCTLELRNKGYCDNRGFISSKTPPPGHPDAGGINNSWAYEYGWVDLPYSFMYKRHFIPLYVNGMGAQGSFVIFEANADQIPNIPEGYFPWIPGCPSSGEAGPYNGSGGNRFPNGVPPIKKRDMKLSTHKAEIWLGSNRKEEAIKLYELGASDLFSGMYNSFILAANESQVDIENRLRRGFTPTLEEEFRHTKFYENWNKNIIDLRIDPRVWVYYINNVPLANYTQPSIDGIPTDPKNNSLQQMIDNLYNRTINLTILDKKIQIIHLKLGLKQGNILNNTDCKGTNGGLFPISANDVTSSQSWEYQKYITIKIKDWKIESTDNILNTNLLPQTFWNKEYIERKFLTSFGNILFNRVGGGSGGKDRDVANQILLRPNNSASVNDLISGNHYEQYNYNQAKSSENILTGTNGSMSVFANSWTYIKKSISFADDYRQVLLSTSSWWAIWDRTILDSSKKRLSTIVGYNKNIYQILTSWNLNPNLNYSAPNINNNRQVTAESYFEYVPGRPKIYIPSNIRSVRDKKVLISNGSRISYLVSRKTILDTYGINFFNYHWDTDWARYITQNRLDSINAPFLTLPSNFYANTTYNYIDTRENVLYRYSNTGNYTDNSQKRFDTKQWFNNLWAQFIYDGSILIDVDSYKNVEFKHPTNPSQYIKFVDTFSNANSEYSFILNQPQDLETVLTPGVLDVTKQVKITKPTNVDLDPNYSFLVYLYPFVEVTKKKKEV